MTKIKWILIALLIFFIFKKRKVMIGLYEILKPFLQGEEGFHPKPYWDQKQWSWGYGTKVPDSSSLKSIVPTGTITKTQGLIDLVKHTDRDKATLQKKITVPLNNNQWAALLSFAYNLGTGNAANLVANINTRRWEVLKQQWLKYYQVKNNDKKIEAALLRRRERELKLFFS